MLFAKYFWICCDRTHSWRWADTGCQQIGVDCTLVLCSQLEVLSCSDYWRGMGRCKKNHNIFEHPVIFRQLLVRYMNSNASYFRGHKY